MMLFKSIIGLMALAHITIAQNSVGNALQALTLANNSISYANTVVESITGKNSNDESIVSGCIPWLV